MTPFSLFSMSRKPKSVIGSTFCLFRKAAAFFFVSICLMAFAFHAWPSAAPKKVRGAERWGPYEPYVIDIDLRDVPPPVQWRPGDAIKEIPRKKVHPTGEEVPPPKSRLDPLLAISESVRASDGQPSFGAPRIDIQGQGFSGVNPPDTVGDVGVNYYIQAINASAGTVYTVYNKSDGSVAGGPFTLDAISEKGSCTDGLGDPIVLYDAYARRWLLSEFANKNDVLCVYISQTSDPIAGGWYNYQFATDNFPDYPKYGVWPDAYYVATNESGGPPAYALQREKMLEGLAADLQRFSAESMSGFSFQALTPCDPDGFAEPPEDSPFYFMRHRDDEAHDPGSNNASEDYLEIFEISVDWDNPGNTVFTGPISVAVSEFDSNLCGLTSFRCFEQPGSSVLLDPIREVIMHRLQYRNFGDYETLTGSFVTDIDGYDTGGIRWFELRKQGTGPWELHQEGTYGPSDGHSRWMSSIAADSRGNIALGYNITSDEEPPGLRYAGRLATDPLGTMPYGENILVSGSSANASNRYGDYAAMAVDPVDGCEFWFTGMYNQSSTWSTHISSFHFDSCVCVPAGIPSSVSAKSNGDNRIRVSWGAVSGADSYRLYRSDESCEADSLELYAKDIADSKFYDTDVSGGSKYYYRVSSYIAADSCESEKSGCAQATATGECRLPPTFEGASEAASLRRYVCGIEVAWEKAASPCGHDLVYNIYRSETSSFEPDSSTLLASCLTGLSYTDENVETGREYFYMVLAESADLSGDKGPCNGGLMDDNRRIVSDMASSDFFILFDDDMESGSGKWITEEGPGNTSGTDPWTLVEDGGVESSAAWFCEDEGRDKDQMLRTGPTISVAGDFDFRLVFWHFYDLEYKWDGGVLEYSTDWGETWQDILEGDGGGISSNSDRFLEGGYSSTIYGNSSSVLADRMAWTGAVSSYRRVVVDLADFKGMTVLFRWRLACDVAVAGEGWWIDDVTVSSYQSCGDIVYVSPADNNCNGFTPCENQLKDALKNATGVNYFLVAQGQYQVPVVIDRDSRVIVGFNPNFSGNRMTAPVSLVKMGR